MPTLSSSTPATLDTASTAAAHWPASVGTDVSGTNHFLPVSVSMSTCVQVLCTSIIHDYKIWIIHLWVSFFCILFSEKCSLAVQQSTPVCFWTPTRAWRLKRQSWWVNTGGIHWKDGIGIDGKYLKWSLRASLGKNYPYWSISLCTQDYLHLGIRVRFEWSSVCFKDGMVKVQQ